MFLFTKNINVYFVQFIQIVIGIIFVHSKLIRNLFDKLNRKIT